MPISDRISNVSLFVAVSLFGAVILWGVFLLAKRMSLMGIVSVDIAFLLPFVLIVSALVYTFKRSV
jgi:phosphoglycerol transferase MdoB-like AlkP superfamily enzyme